MTDRATVESTLACAVLDEIGMGVVLVGPDETILWANQWFREAAGKAEDELLQGRIQEIFPTLQDSRVMGVLSACLEKGRAGYLSHSLNRTLFPLFGPEQEASQRQPMRQLVRVTPLQVAPAQQGALIQIEDLTDSHLREQLLRSMTRELEHRVEERTAALRQAQKMEAVGQLAGGVAHDFNNLLMVIMGNLEFVEDHLARDPRTWRHVELVRQAAESGAEVAGRLLAFSRREKRSPRTVDLKDCLGNIMGLLRSSIGEHVVLESELAEALPEVHLDTGQLQNAVVNLAINARDAMPRGGTITLRTSLVQAAPGTAGGMDAGNAESPCVRLEISDNGFGIPEEIRDQVLEPFFTTKGEGQGTGLGLAMVYQFMEDSGGRLEIHSTVGEGTTIHMDFPVPEHSITTPEVGPRSEKIQGGHEHVLVVENEESVRELIREMLLSLGYLPLSVASGAEALEVLAQDRASIDLVLSDVMMPGGMDGVELREEVTRRYPGLPVLLASGYAGNNGLGDEDPEASILWKPFTRASLATALRTSLTPPSGEGPTSPPPSAQDPVSL